MTKADLLAPHTALELANISVRLYRVHKDLIDRAAALVEGRTPSDYVRETMAMQAALDLDEELPLVPEITRGRSGSIESQAALKLGLTREEFLELAARRVAADVLAADAPDDRGSRPTPVPPRHSTMRPAARPGSYSAQPDAPGEYVRSRKAK